MSMLTSFQFENQEVRFVGTAEAPEWVAADVIKILYPDSPKNYRANYLLKIPSHWKGLKQIQTPGGKQAMTTLYEPGLYFLLARSDSEMAVPFQEWICEDVLPSIRKTGSYSLPQQRQHTVQDELSVIQMCLDVAGLDRKLTAGVMLNHAGLQMPALKQAVAESHSLLAASMPSELLLTPTKIGEELGVSARKVNLLLMDLGYQIKNLNKNSKDEPAYFPTEIGQPYASNTLATGRLYDNGADNTTYQHLKWKSQIVDILREQLVGADI